MDYKRKVRYFYFLIEKEKAIAEAIRKGSGSSDDEVFRGSNT